MLAYIYTSTCYVNKITATHPRLHISCFSPEQFCIIIRVGETTISEGASQHASANIRANGGMLSEAAPLESSSPQRGAR